ncbi:MAG: ATP synthase subunit I [Pseudolysinimonas sp.]
MNELFKLVLATLGGGLLGLLHFGGLWWSLRRALESPRPALWVGFSLLLRMACIAAGFVVISAGDWRKMAACVLGFWVSRWLVIRVTARLASPVLRADREAGPA